MRRIGSKDLLGQRVDLCGHAVERPRPVGGELLVQQLLGAIIVFDPGETVSWRKNRRPAVSI